MCLHKCVLPQLKFELGGANVHCTTHAQTCSLFKLASWMPVDRTLALPAWSKSCQLHQRFFSLFSQFCRLNDGDNILASHARNIWTSSASSSVLACQAPVKGWIPALPELPQDRIHVLDLVPPAVLVMWVLTVGGGEGWHPVQVVSRLVLTGGLVWPLDTWQHSGLVPVLSLSAGLHLPHTRELLRPSSWPAPHCLPRPPGLSWPLPTSGSYMTAPTWPSVWQWTLCSSCWTAAPCTQW